METCVKALKHIELESSWKERLSVEFQQDYIHTLKQFLIQEKKANKCIYPPGKLYFNAYNLTPFDTVKVVILGQDPYHGSNQAHGLCFSVQQGIELPPSLQNIFQELHSDLGIPIPKYGDLTHWAKQGVFLLNAVLTVRAGKAGAHQGKGWEQFTNKTIEILNAQKEHLVFMLWGAYAQQKIQHIDAKKHLILTAPHPSPLSAHRGFFGCKHFSRANAYLISHGKTPIDWCLPLSPL